MGRSQGLQLNMKQAPVHDTAHDSGGNYAANAFRFAAQTVASVCKAIRKGEDDIEARVEKMIAQVDTKVTGQQEHDMPPHAELIDWYRNACKKSGENCFADADGLGYVQQKYAELHEAVDKALRNQRVKAYTDCIKHAISQKSCQIIHRILGTTPESMVESVP